MRPSPGRFSTTPRAFPSLQIVFAPRPSATWFSEWLRRKEVKIGRETADRYKGVINTFLTELDKQTPAPPGDLLYAGHRPTLYPSAEVVLRHDSQAACGGHSVRARPGTTGRVDRRNPAEAVKSQDGVGQSHEPFTNAEAAMLFTAAGTEWCTLALQGAHTGARLVTRASLRWNPHGRGRRLSYSQAQLFRVHLLAVLSPVHSFNLLARLLPEQPAWCRFARIRSASRTPDVRMLHDFRARLGVSGLRNIVVEILRPIIERYAALPRSIALIDSTDLEASDVGFKKRHGHLRRPGCRVGSTYHQDGKDPMVRRLQEAHPSSLAPRAPKQRSARSANLLGYRSQCL
jgi:hypothetical protein